MDSWLFHGDAIEEMQDLKSCSVDSLVTDPPAGIGFMGKEWDHHKGGRKEWCAWMESVMRECLRVMKPGAHGLVWALPRTSHWTATALEDAGFEIRDCVYHLFGSGFPKSLDVSKAIDKAAGAERKILGKDMSKWRDASKYAGGKYSEMRQADYETKCSITAPATDAAKQWAGWGTALKPAVECWWLVRKPCSEKTVAANVLKWGTGTLNIDASRVEAADQATLDAAVKRMTGNVVTNGNAKNFLQGQASVKPKSAQGRFPSHLLLDEEAGAMLDAQSGTLKSGVFKHRKTAGIWSEANIDQAVEGERGGSSGGASRFFYCAKISASERNAGLEGMEAKVTTDGRAKSIDNPFLPGETERLNTHPTVKPQKLMRYLAKLVTPPGGVVLDPFMGSGSTGLAAKSEGFGFVGIEKEKEYYTIAMKRIR